MFVNNRAQCYDLRKIYVNIIIMNVASLLFSDIKNFFSITVHQVTFCWQFSGREWQVTWHLAANEISGNQVTFAMWPISDRVGWINKKWKKWGMPHFLSQTACEEIYNPTNVLCRKMCQKFSQRILSAVFNI